MEKSNESIYLCSFTYCSRLYFLSGAGNLELQVVSVLCVNLEKDCPDKH